MLAAMAAGSPRSAAFFDLDKTIIARSSTLAFARPFFDGGLMNRRSVLRSAYAQFVFATSGADQDQMARMREYLTQLVAGWDVDVVRQCVSETLHTIIDPLVYVEAVDLIASHHRAGRDVIIVSASSTEVVEPIGSLLGVDHVIASRLVEENGRYTGEIGFYAYGENKAAAMREMAERLGYDLDSSFAYSDSETDAPMLSIVGHPFAVNPDRRLRDIAVQNDWPILEFDRPVELRSRLPLDTTPRKVMAGGAAAAASALGILLWRMRRKHGRA